MQSKKRLLKLLVPILKGLCKPQETFVETCKSYQPQQLSETHLNQHELGSKTLLGLDSGIVNP